MKTIIQASPVQIAASIPEHKKLNDYFVKPLKAGFLGFTTILMLIFFINLLAYVVGSNEKFGLDVLDLLLAVVGFILQTLSNLFKCFIK